MPEHKTQQFWNSRELMELWRRQQATFRRTVESETHPSEQDESDPSKANSPAARINAKTVERVPSAALRNSR